MKLFLSVKIKRDNTRDKRRFCTSIQTVKRTVSDCTNAQMHVFHPLVSKSGHYVYGWCVVKSRGDHLIPMSFCCELSLIDEILFRSFSTILFLILCLISYIIDIRPIEFYWTNQYLFFIFPWYIWSTFQLWFHILKVKFWEGKLRIVTPSTEICSSDHRKSWLRIVIILFLQLFAMYVR